MYTYIYIYVSTCLSIYAHTYVDVYVYLYIYIHMHVHQCLHLPRRGILKTCISVSIYIYDSFPTVRAWSCSNFRLLLSVAQKEYFNQGTSRPPNPCSCLIVPYLVWGAGSSQSLPRRGPRRCRDQPMQPIMA